MVVIGLLLLTLFFYILFPRTGQKIGESVLGKNSESHKPNKNNDPRL